MLPRPGAKETLHLVLRDLVRESVVVQVSVNGGQAKIKDTIISGNSGGDCYNGWVAVSVVEEKASRVVEVPTWHLHCAEVLGSAYTGAIQQSVETWFPDATRGPGGPPAAR